MSSGQEHCAKQLEVCAEELVASFHRIERLIEGREDAGNGHDFYRDELSGVVGTVMRLAAQMCDAAEEIADPLLGWEDPRLHAEAGAEYMKPSTATRRTTESLPDRGERLWKAFEKSIRRDCPPIGRLFSRPAADVLAPYQKPRGKPRPPIRLSVFRRYWKQTRGAVAGDPKAPRRGMKRDKT